MLAASPRSLPQTRTHVHSKEAPPPGAPDGAQAPAEEAAASREVEVDGGYHHGVGSGPQLIGQGSVPAAMHPFTDALFQS